jgi:hypothetical protein
MSPRSRAYFYCVVGIGVFLFSNGLGEFKPTDFQQFFAYLALGMLSATWRVKIPGIPVNVSPVFAFVLIGIANYSLGEALVIACGSTFVQCMWRPGEKRNTRKIMFNVATVAIGVSIAYNPSHFLLSESLRNAPRILPAAGLVFFIVNTGLVSGMVALVEQEGFRSLWRNLTHHLIWYYAAGGLLATLIIIGNRLGGWQAGFLITPFLYLMYQYYREYLRRRSAVVQS